MSNALHLATSAPAAGGPAPAEPVGRFFLIVLAVGVFVLVVFLIVRLLRPGKFFLSHVPGRGNRAPVTVVLGVYLAYLLASLFLRQGMAAAAGVAMRDLSVANLLLVALVAQLLLAGGSLVFAAGAFRHGLARGLGLSARHWVYDSGRAGVGCLAVLPLCYGTLTLTDWLIRSGWLPVEVHRHPVLEFLPSASPGWLVVVVLATVLVAPVSEEVFFRGLLQSAIRRHGVHPWVAVALASATFALAHGEQYQDMPALFVLALALGYNYERSGRLLAPILMHALFNAVMLVARMGW